MDVGIYAPYGYHEVTSAAVRLADCAVRHGLGVRWVSPDLPSKGVHTYWDNRVRPASQGKNVYRWAFGCGRLAWFNHHPRDFRKASLVAPKAANSLVVRWHTLSQADAEKLQGYAHLVCPSQGIYKAARLWAEPEQPVRWCGWDCGLTPVRRAAWHAAAPKIYVPADSYSVEYAGHSLLLAVAAFLDRDNLASVTVAPNRAWPTTCRKAWKAALAAYGGRLSVQPRTCLVKEVTRFHDHDWTLLPSVRSEFGLLALRSLACGVPVLAFDVQPVSELVHSYNEGMLLPCEITTNWMGAPTAVFDGAEVGERLAKICHTDELWRNCAEQDWALERRRLDFDSFWARLWGVL
jgi:glycosyltransferase involved in cell wall biosynthesis